ncbi:Alpha/Beta hydrolase protein [Lipomyces japonicus]|uniref:Alpha/Beta hydrolase protein n=1 Tax=Lipomyces japonicus TaxID=56871 RepID=UPI0034CDF3A4
MAPRLPTKDDFPSSCVVSITPPASLPLSYCVILLHGLGDKIAPFTALAQRLNLPRAAVIAIQAPTPMPFDLGGYHWGDDIVFNKDPTASSASNNNDDDDVLSPDAEFNRARKFIWNQVLKDTIVAKCGFKLESEVIIWGYAQGGMVALDIAATQSNLAAVISVGGWIPSFTAPRDIISPPRTSKILITGGDDHSKISKERIQAAEQIWKECVRVQYPRMKSDLMPRNRDEMAPILRFLLRILIPDELKKQGLS